VRSPFIYKVYGKITPLVKLIVVLNPPVCCILYYICIIRAKHCVLVICGYDCVSVAAGLTDPVHRVGLLPWLYLNSYGLNLSIAFHEAPTEINAATVIVRWLQIYTIAEESCFN